MSNNGVNVGTSEWWSVRTRFEPTTGCVLWTGFRCPQGYARTHWKGKGGVLVHRVAYEQVYGEFDTSLKVCHRCDTPNCVNPAHLFLGTQRDNLHDMFAKGRARPQGRTLTAPAKLRPAPAVSAPLALEIPHEDVVIRDLIHLTRPIGNREEPLSAPDGAVSAWCRVTGVPPKRPTQALVVWERPISWTNVEPNVSRHESMVSLGCGLSDRGGRR